MPESTAGPAAAICRRTDRRARQGLTQLDVQTESTEGASEGKAQASVPNVGARICCMSAWTI